MRRMTKDNLLFDFATRVEFSVFFGDDCMEEGSTALFGRPPHDNPQSRDHGSIHSLCISGKTSLAQPRIDHRDDDACLLHRKSGS
jgi:hypothetical protein